MISRKPMLAVILLIPALTGCFGTGTTQAPTAGLSAVKAVPCVSLPLLAYHAPKDATELTELLDRTLADPHNVFDTPDTISTIRQTNAAIAAVCNH